MPKVAKMMTPLAVSRLRAPGFHRVGGPAGLGIQITKEGARTWVLRFKLGSKPRRDMGLGGESGVSLAQAREKAAKARELLDRAIDPIEERLQARSAALAESDKGRTFEQCAVEYIEGHEAGWSNDKHRQQWENTLTTYTYPHIGQLLVAHVDLPHVMRILQQKEKPDSPPLWVAKTETASRLRARIEKILDFAAVSGYRPKGPNPARWKGNLDALLPKPSKVANEENHPALPVADLGAFMHDLRRREGIAAKGLEFAILTAARSGEVRGCLWSEIDMANKVWVLPPARMKAKREHRVPLSDAALKLLRALQRTEGVDLVFAAASGKMLSDMTLSAVVRRMNEATEKPRWVDPKLGREATPHGFRSTFRDWCSERTRYPSEMAELALAHSVGSKTIAAYARSDMFARRLAMMGDWAKFCGRIESRDEKSNVVSIQAGRNASAGD